MTKPFDQLRQKMSAEAREMVKIEVEKLMEELNMTDEQILERTKNLVNLPLAMGVVGNKRNPRELRINILVNGVTLLSLPIEEFYKRIDS